MKNFIQEFRRLTARKMLFELLIILKLVVGILMEPNLDFGIDFFVHKKVVNIAKFSCDNADDDIQFIKLCFHFGIYSNVYHPKSLRPVANILKNSDRLMGVWLDTRCVPEKIIANIVSEASKKYLFGKLHKWLVIGNDFNSTLMHLNEDAMNLLNDIVIAVASPNESYTLFDVYNPDKLRNGKMNITKYGSWKIDKGLNVELTQDLFSRRQNLHGMHMSITALAQDCDANATPLQCLTNYKRWDQDMASKFGLELFLTLGEMYNFRLNITIVHKWLDTFPNGTVHGMMPALKNNEADFGATPTSNRWASAGFARYIMPIWYLRYFFIFRDPTKTIKLTELLDPLSTQVWYAIAAVVIFSSILLMWLLWFEDGGNLIIQWGRGILITIATTAQQGLIVVPNRISSRIALLSLMIFFLLTISHYSATVVKTRLNIPPDRLNDSLWSLGNVKGMKFGALFYIPIESFLKESATWESQFFYKNIWTKIPPNETFLPIDVALKKVQKGHYAYHASPAAVYPYIGNHFSEETICELAEIHSIKPTFAALYERLHNPFAELVRVGFCKMWSSGIRARNALRFIPSKYQCSANIRSTQPLSIFDVVTAYIVLGCGMIISTFIFTFEVIINKINKFKDGKSKVKKKLEWKLLIKNSLMK